MKVEIIRVDGSKETHEISKESIFTKIYKLIGCTGGDGVDLHDGRSMIVDDTGLIDGKPVNHEATKLYHGVCRPGTTHPICGDVAIVLDEDFA